MDGARRKRARARHGEKEGGLVGARRKKKRGELTGRDVPHGEGEREGALAAADGVRLLRAQRRSLARAAGAVGRGPMHGKVRYTKVWCGTRHGELRVRAGLQDPALRDEVLKLNAERRAAILRAQSGFTASAIKIRC